MSIQPGVCSLLNLFDYLKSSRLTITPYQLYLFVGHGVRWFGDLTCDFAEVFGERSLQEPITESVYASTLPLLADIESSVSVKTHVSEARPIRQAQGKLWGTRFGGGVRRGPPASSAFTGRLFSANAKATLDFSQKLSILSRLQSIMAPSTSGARLSRAPAEYLRRRYALSGNCPWSHSSVCAFRL